MYRNSGLLRIVRWYKKMNNVGAFTYYIIVTLKIYFLIDSFLFLKNLEF